MTLKDQRILFLPLLFSWDKLFSHMQLQQILENSYSELASAKPRIQSWLVPVTNVIVYTVFTWAIKGFWSSTLWGPRNHSPHTWILLSILSESCHVTASIPFWSFYITFHPPELTLISFKSRRLLTLKSWWTFILLPITVSKISCNSLEVFNLLPRTWSAAGCIPLQCLLLLSFHIYKEICNMVATVLQWLLYLRHPSHIGMKHHCLCPSTNPSTLAPQLAECFLNPYNFWLIYIFMSFNKRQLKLFGET